MRLSELICAGTLCAVAACDGDASMRAGAGVAAWTGTYDAVWDGATTATSPPGHEAVIDHLDNVIMTVTALDEGRIEIRWQMLGHAGTGAASFTVNGNNATLLKGEKGMPTCDLCTATLDGDTLTQRQEAHTSGFANGEAWSGAYTGSWVGTRLR